MLRAVGRMAAACCCVTMAAFLEACGGGAAPGNSGPAPPATSISLVQVVTGLVNPVAITNAGDGSGRLFVAEQGGSVRIVRNGVLAAQPFLNITGIVSAGGEQGLLGLAFPPGFATRQSFYVNFTNRTGVGDTVIASIAVGPSPDGADPTTLQELLTVPQPFANHNGGQLAFGPDGFLYIGSGDGGSGGDPLGNAQNTASLLGKILRLHVLDGPGAFIPPGNPFGTAVWAYGLRNPWRFSFDRMTGDLYVADVGQASREEVNFLPVGIGAGANFGWNIMEGNLCYLAPGLCNPGGLVLPVVEYDHSLGNCSVTGGYVYRGAITPLQGTYLYGDFCSGRIWGLRRNAGGWESLLLLDTPFLISTFGEDEAGELYVADYGSGTIYRVAAP